MDLNLGVFEKDPYFKKEAMKHWEVGDVLQILCLMPNTANLAFVLDNFMQLKDIGKYEESLLNAYISTRINNTNLSMDLLRFLFEIADIQKLRSAGDPIPNQDFFTLYRGVSGQGRKRRVNSFSWTESPNTAAWFAMRFPDLQDPAVFTVTTPNESIIACCDDRGEREYLLKLPLPVKPKRLKEMPEILKTRPEK